MAADNLEPKEIARRFVEDVWGKSDYTLARRIVDANVIHHRQRRDEPFGIEGLFQGLRMYDAAFPERRFVQEDVMVDGKRVANRWTMSAVHSGTILGNPPTGNLVSLTGMNRYIIEGGKIIVVSHDEDIYGLMLQLGGLPGGGRPAPDAAAAQSPRDRTSTPRDRGRERKG